MAAGIGPWAGKGISMSRIVIAWELGKGFGHLAPYLDLVTTLQKKGHQVVFVSRDVGHAEQLFGKMPIVILQAPMTMHGIANPYRIQYSFTHLLHNIGFADFDNLFGLVKAWRHVFNYARPDLVIFDHSPTALLAAKAYDWKKVVSGSGFLVPPQRAPMPMMRYWQQYDQEQLKREEAQLLGIINRVQKAVQGRPLDAVSDLYRSDAEFLLSFQELDHYPDRGAGNYVGMFSQPGHGVAPDWPQGPGMRVFAYLHPWKDLPKLLELFARGKFATLVYGAEIQESLRKKYEKGNLRFSRRPLDIAQVAKSCNFAITNATFGTTAAFLQHGKPVLTIPTNLERIMVAKRVTAIGAGVAVSPAKPETTLKGMRALFENDKFRQGARAFQKKYGNLDQAWQTARMLESIEALLGAPGAQLAPAKAPPAAKKSARGAGKPGKGRRGRK